MIIFCDECGERYIIKDTDIKEKMIMFDCRICNELIKVIIPDCVVRNPAEREITKN